MKRLLLISCAIALTLLSGCKPPLPITFHYTPMNLSFDEMKASAHALVHVTVLAPPQDLKLDDNTPSGITFTLTKLRIDTVVRGPFQPDDEIQIIQTKGMPIDIVMRKNQKYCLFLNTYRPGDFDELKKLTRTYIIMQANKGIFRVESPDKIFSYNMEGEEYRDKTLTPKVQEAFRLKE